MATLSPVGTSWQHVELNPDVGHMMTLQGAGLSPRGAPEPGQCMLVEVSAGRGCSDADGRDGHEQQGERPAGARICTGSASALACIARKDLQQGNILHAGGGTKQAMHRSCMAPQAVNRSADSSCCRYGTWRGAHQWECNAFRWCPCRAQPGNYMCSCSRRAESGRQEAAQ